MNQSLKTKFILLGTVGLVSAVIFFTLRGRSQQESDWPIVVNSETPAKVAETINNPKQLQSALLPAHWHLPDPSQQPDGNDGRHHYDFDYPSQEVDLAIGRLTSRSGVRSVNRDGKVVGLSGVLRDVTSDAVADALQTGTWASRGLPAIPNRTDLEQLAKFVGDVVTAITSSRLGDMITRVGSSGDSSEAVVSILAKVAGQYQPAGLLFVEKDERSFNVLMNDEFKVRVATRLKTRVNAQWVDAMRRNDMPILEYRDSYVEAYARLPVITSSGEQGEVTIDLLYSTGKKRWLLTRIVCETPTPLTSMAQPSSTSERLEISLDDYPSVVVAGP